MCVGGTLNRMNKTILLPCMLLFFIVVPICLYGSEPTLGTSSNPKKETLKTIQPQQKKNDDGCTLKNVVLATIDHPSVWGPPAVIIAACANCVRMVSENPAVPIVFAFPAKTFFEVICDTDGNILPLRVALVLGVPLVAYVGGVGYAVAQVCKKTLKSKRTKSLS